MCVVAIDPTKGDDKEWKSSVLKWLRQDFGYSVWLHDMGDLNRWVNLGYVRLGQAK